MGGQCVASSDKSSKLSAQMNEFKNFCFYLSVEVEFDESIQYFIVSLIDISLTQSAASGRCGIGL